MKVTFIYAYENEEWSTPLALATEFGSLGWEVEIVSIGSNRLQNWNDSQIRKWLDDIPNSDIVLFMDWGGFDSPLLDKKLVDASINLKNNLKTYLSEYIMLTDAVNIKDAFAVNIGINYDIVTRPNYSGRDVILGCNNKLKELFDITKWNINQPINLAYLRTELDKVKGVQTVQKIEIVNKTGNNYSPYAYDVKGAVRNDIVYPSYDPCIFEVKFPDIDIKGRVTTL